VIVATARGLSEGVDVPELDGVMFADPRDSITDVVQATGRALRLGAAASKTATIIIPVLLAGGETAETTLDRSAFATAWKVIRALRTHDDRVADWQETARLAGGNRGGPGSALPDWLTLLVKADERGSDLVMALDRKEVQQRVERVFAREDVLEACVRRDRGQEKPTSDLGVILNVMKSHGLTQGVISGLTGIGQGRLSEFKHGKRQPTLDTLERFADGLGLPEPARAALGLKQAGQGEVSLLRALLLSRLVVPTC
jgi:hypothetical protein